MIPFIIKGIGLTVPQDSITHVAEAIVRFTGTLWVGVPIQAVLFFRTALSIRVALSIWITLVGRSGNGGGDSGGFCYAAGFHLPRFLALLCHVVPDVRGTGVVPSCAKEALAVFRFATRYLVLAVLVSACSIFQVTLTIVVKAHGSKLDMSSVHRGQEKEAYKQRLVLHPPSY